MTLLHGYWQKLPLPRSQVAAALDQRGNGDGLLDPAEVAKASLDEFKELMGDVAEAAGHRREDAFRLGEMRAPSVALTLGGGTLAGLALAGVASAVFPPLAPVALALGPALGVAATVDELRVVRRNNAYADAGRDLREAFVKAHPELASRLR